MAEPKQEPRQLQVRFPEETLKGRYANMVRIDATPEEFIFDFGLINPSQGNGIISDRIIMNPRHVKRMIEVLNRVMSSYEQTNGIVSPSETPKEIGFQTS